MLYESVSSVHKLSNTFYPNIVQSFPSAIKLSKRPQEQSKTILKMKDRLLSIEKYRVFSARKPCFNSNKSPPKTASIPLYYGSKNFTKNITNSTIKKTLFKKSDKIISSFVYSRTKSSKKRTLKQAQELFKKSILPLHPENSCRKVLLLRDIIQYNNDSRKKLIDAINEDKGVKPIPIEKRADYFNYIRRKSQLNYSHKFTSHAVHEMTSNKILDKYNYKQQELEYLNKQKLKIKLSKDLESEEKDTVKDLPSMKDQKISRLIKSLLLSKESKLIPESALKYKMSELYPDTEKFINNYYDACIPPNFISKFINVRLPDFITRKNLPFTKYNLLDYKALKYVNKLKVIRQREADRDYIFEKKKKEYFEILRKRNEQKTKNGDDINSSDEEGNDEKFLKYFMAKPGEKKMSKEEKEQIEKEQREMQYYIEGFFIHKYSMYNKINLADDKIKDCLYNNPNFNVKDYHNL